MIPTTAPTVANPPLHLIAAFNRHFPHVTAQWVLQAPTHDTWIAAAPGEPDAYTYALACAERPGRAIYTRQSARVKQTVLRRPLPDWARYPSGVMLDLGDSGLDVPSIRAVVLGEATTSPRYEYGLGVAVAALWHTICNLPFTADGLREIVDRVRREYIG